MLALQVVNQIELVDTGERNFNRCANDQSRMGVDAELQLGGLVDKAAGCGLHLAAQRLANDREVKVARNRALQHCSAGLARGSQQRNEPSLICRFVFEPRHNRVDE